ncbi:PIG-L family deacetylase [Candidatus Roizmanbacteria bacterium]|nr:PIG-L family deacetylase [Candidatus Roizmanbacteria bacterium]
MQTKKKTIAVIVAHPDDEAFGPSGTIAKFAKEGHDVYILCATKGEEGQNHSHGEALREIHDIREEELRCSAKILGVKEVIFLGFRDGSLSNNLYHQLAKEITEVLKRIKAEMIITLEHRGVSGHIDHVAVSMVSSYVFEHLDSIKTIYYYCTTKKARGLQSKYRPEGYFIYFPPGYDPENVDKIIDITDVWDIKTRAMNCHKSQLKDVRVVQGIHSEIPKREHFFVREK